MNDQGIRLERLSSQHDLSGFNSANAELDGWLGRHALTSQKMDSARTFVVVRSSRVIAYVSLTVGSVQRADAPPRLVRGLPAYPVGVVLIARLAVANSEQGRGLGSRLLAEALRMAVAAGEAAAARLVVVDAIDDRAAEFYRRHGFVEALDTMRLYRRMKDVRASLGQRPMDRT
ncbi:MAG: GNAT family N-acetyltransferase [Acidimicrobiales bacterium]